MDRLKGWWARFRVSAAWRAWKRYMDARGSLLAGGVGYFAFFSVFPALLLAFTIFGFVLRDQPQLLADTRNAVEDILPGFVRTPENPDGIISIEPPRSRTLTIGSIVSVLGLVLAGTGWLDALRNGIRAVFGAPGDPGNLVVKKLKDLGVLAVLGVMIVASAAVGGVAGKAAGWLAELVGLDGRGWVLTVVSLIVGALLDAGIVLVMLRLLSGVDVPWRGLRNAAVFGGITLTLLKKFGTLLISSTVHNPLFASFAVVVGLLVWLNLMSRVLLISAAWAANDLDTSSGELSAGQRHKLAEGPVERPLTTVRQRTDAGLPTFGQRTADRTSVAAGAVLGAVAAAGLGAVARGLRSLTRRH